MRTARLLTVSRSIRLGGRCRGVAGGLPNPPDADPPGCIPLPPDAEPLDADHPPINADPLKMQTPRMQTPLWTDKHLSKHYLAPNFACGW